MTITDINEQIDSITSHMTRAETLNALHACRPDHPLGRDDPFKWRNAHAMVMQANWLERSDVPVRSVDWLWRMAAAEALETTAA